jgi:hypothetical protein
MARRVFFSFHYERDAQRASVVRNSWVTKLPTLSAPNKYPTIGPSGMVEMNINGMAASLELYLGADVLSDEQGCLTPIQWTGYESGVGQYQGEIMFKAKIQERFKRKLEMCRADPSFLEKADWSGLRSILSAIFEAFHQLDKKLIQDFATVDPL